MALEYNLDKTKHAALDESLQSLYKADGEGFRLDVTGTDEAKELKEALRKEREASAAAKKKAGDLETANTEAERLRLEKQGEFEALYKKSEETNTATTKKLSDLQDKVANGARSTEALKIATSLTKDTSRAALLQKEALQFITHTEEGGVKMNGPDGSAWTPELMGAHLTEAYPFLVDGSQASGGGAGGDGGGGSAKTMTRADFSKQTPVEQSAFMKDGGSVTD